MKNLFPITGLMFLAAASPSAVIDFDAQYGVSSGGALVSDIGAAVGSANPGNILQFDYQLTLGLDAAGTSYSVRLQNLTDGTDTGTGTVTGVDSTIYTALTGTGAYGFFQSITPGANGSGLSGLQVNSVTIEIR